MENKDQPQANEQPRQNNEPQQRQTSRTSAGDAEKAFKAATHGVDDAKPTEPGHAAVTRETTDH